jgi:hypothetical protein
MILINILIHVGLGKSSYLDIFMFSYLQRSALQWFYRILQALALEEDIPEAKDAEDKTIPRYRQIQKVSLSTTEKISY